MLHLTHIKKCQMKTAQPVPDHLSDGKKLTDCWQPTRTAMWGNWPSPHTCWSWEITSHSLGALWPIPININKRPAIPSPGLQSTELPAYVLKKNPNKAGCSKQQYCYSPKLEINKMVSNHVTTERWSHHRGRGRRTASPIGLQPVHLLQGPLRMRHHLLLLPAQSALPEFHHEETQANLNRETAYSLLACPFRSINIMKDEGRLRIRPDSSGVRSGTTKHNVQS